MNKVVRYEFLGSPLLFALLLLSGILLPFGIIYLLKQTLALHHQMDDPEEFVRQFRSGKIG